MQFVRNGYNRTYLPEKEELGNIQTVSDQNAINLFFT